MAAGGLIPTTFCACRAAVAIFLLPASRAECQSALRGHRTHRGLLPGPANLSSKRKNLPLAAAAAAAAADRHHGFFDPTWRSRSATFFVLVLISGSLLIASFCIDCHRGRSNLLAAQTRHARFGRKCKPQQRQDSQALQLGRWHRLVRQLPQWSLRRASTTCPPGSAFARADRAHRARPTAIRPPRVIQRQTALQ